MRSFLCYEWVLGCYYILIGILQNFVIVYLHYQGIGSLSGWILPQTDDAQRCIMKLCRRIFADLFVPGDKVVNKSVAKELSLAVRLNAERL